MQAPEEDSGNPNDNALQKEAAQDSRFKTIGQTEEVLGQENPQVKKIVAAISELQQVSERNAQEIPDEYRRWASKTCDLRMTCKPDGQGTKPSWQKDHI